MLGFICWYFFPWSWKMALSKGHPATFIQSACTEFIYLRELESSEKSPSLSLWWTPKEMQTEGKEMWKTVCFFSEDTYIRFLLHFFGLCKRDTLRTDCPARGTGEIPTAAVSELQLDGCTMPSPAGTPASKEQVMYWRNWKDTFGLSSSRHKLIPPEQLKTETAHQFPNRTESFTHTFHFFFLKKYQTQSKYQKEYNKHTFYQKQHSK